MNHRTRHLFELAAAAPCREFDCEPDLQSGLPPASEHIHDLTSEAAHARLKQCMPAFSNCKLYVLAQQINYVTDCPSRDKTTGDKGGGEEHESRDSVC